MPIKPMDPETWKKKRSRVLLAGEPGARKTTSLLTWPRPLHVLIMPGEKGGASIIPDPANGVYVYAFEEEHPDKKTPSAMVVMEVKKWTGEILAGKHGPVMSFAVDGLHKLSDYMMDAATAGKFLNGEEFEPTLWGLGRRDILNYVSLVQHSPVENIVFTCWAGPERDRPDKSCKTSHIWPDLPGQLAKKALGEFTAVLYASIRPHPKDPQQMIGVWQLQPDDIVWGCGVKCPVEVARTLPRYIPQDFSILMAALDGRLAPASGEAANNKTEGNAE